MKHSIDIRPFDVPYYVRLDTPSTLSGPYELPGIPLADLSVETLDALCAEFRRAVFEKAGKKLDMQRVPINNLIDRINQNSK